MEIKVKSVLKEIPIFILIDEISFLNDVDKYNIIFFLSSQIKALGQCQGRYVVFN